MRYGQPGVESVDVGVYEIAKGDVIQVGFGQVQHVLFQRNVIT